MPTNQTDTSGWDRIDEHRMAHLDDVGSPGYSAVIAITSDGEERLVLAWRDGVGHPDPYWPDDWRQLAPHELTGRLPKPYAPMCGCTATSSGRPCRVRVPMYGDACPRHAPIDSERSQPV
jgi:hypothetical protein